jgi:hypothetical protein
MPYYRVTGEVPPKAAYPFPSPRWGLNPGELNGKKGVAIWCGAGSRFPAMTASAFLCGSRGAVRPLPECSP